MSAARSPPPRQYPQQQNVVSDQKTGSRVSRIVVIGGGAAGLMAAADAAKASRQKGVTIEVLLLEKNAKAGVKILMSGGTRCNITHDLPPKGILDAFGPQGRFLRKSVGRFPPKMVVRHFEDLGVATKREPTGKIFPLSDRAVHVRDALLRDAVESGVRVHYHADVREIRPSGSSSSRWTVRMTDADIPADAVIVTVGGQSWPRCGTTGDGYRWMSQLGHRIESPRPALVPLLGGNTWTHSLSGLTLADCRVSVSVDGDDRSPADPRRACRSSLLFTHFGFSGPAAMDVSGSATRHGLDSNTKMHLSLDLLPDHSHEQLDRSLREHRQSHSSSRLSAWTSRWLPNRLSREIASRLDDPVMSQLSKPTHRQVLHDLKGLRLSITGTQGFPKAEVTAGGVCLDEVDPVTLASRIHDGLFIAGEILDVDGPIGGYNFQAAFATGRAAGLAATDDVSRLP